MITACGGDGVDMKIRQDFLSIIRHSKIACRRSGAAAGAGKVGLASPGFALRWLAVGRG